MARYIWFNPGKFKGDSRTTTVDGMEIFVELSPFHRPKGVVGTYEAEPGCFTIEFKYIDEETRKTEPVIVDKIEIIEGKHSGKVLAVRIPIDHAPLDQVGVITLRTRVLEALRARRKDMSEALAREKTGGRHAGALSAKVAEEALDESSFRTLATELIPSS